MAALTFSDIETRCANQLRIPTSNTTEITKLDALINEVYRDICAKVDWWWLGKKWAVNTLQKQEGSGPTSTATVLGQSMYASGTTTLAGDSGAGGYTYYPAFTSGQQYLALSTTLAWFNIGTINPYATATGPKPMYGLALLVTGQSEDSNAFYRPIFIDRGQSDGSDRLIQLDTPYTGQSLTTGVGWTMYQDGYQLPTDVGRLLNVTVFGDTVPLTRIGIEEMQRLKQFDRSEGKPQCYSIYDRARLQVVSTDASGNRYYTTGYTDGGRLLQIHPFPDQIYRMEVWYRRAITSELSGTTEPLIPNEFREVLVYGTLARGYAIFLNDLERSAFFQNLFNDALALMSAQQREYASDHPQMVPENRFYRRSGVRGRGRVSMGSYFDRWPYQV